MILHLPPPPSTTCNWLPVTNLVLQATNFKLITTRYHHLGLPIIGNYSIFLLLFLENIQLESTYKFPIYIYRSSRPRTVALLKKDWHRCFPVNFAKFLRTQDSLSYIKLIGFRVVARYTSLNHTLEYDLNLAIVIAKRSKICEKILVTLAVARC